MLVVWPLQPFVFYLSNTKWPSYIFYLMRHNRQHLFDMSYLEDFAVFTGVGVDVSKFFGVGAEVWKPEAGAESESEKCDSAESSHLCRRLRDRARDLVKTSRPRLSSKIPGPRLELKFETETLKYVHFADSFVLSSSLLRWFFFKFLAFLRVVLVVPYLQIWQTMTRWII